MRCIRALLGAAVFGMLAQPASAAVTYHLDGFLFGFQVETSQFVPRPTTIDVDDTDYCGVFILSCTSLTLYPGVTVHQKSYDGLSLNIGEYALGFLFDRGDLGKTGTYESVYGMFDTTATLTVSGTPTVPLPASAPLFGAALLSLGAAGVMRFGSGRRPSTGGAPFMPTLRPAPIQMVNRNKVS